MTKHTPGKLIASDGALICENVNQYGNFIVADCQRERVPEDNANLDRLAHCWNTHDQLLEALKLAKSVLINPSQRTTDIIESAIDAATSSQP